MESLYLTLRGIFYGIIFTLTIGGIFVFNEDNSFLLDPFVIKLLSVIKMSLLANAVLILSSFFVVLFVVIIELIGEKQRKKRKKNTLNNYQKYYIKK